MTILERMAAFDKEVTAMHVEQEAHKHNQNALAKRIDELTQTVKITEEEFIICRDAIEVLRQVSDQSVHDSYAFISKSVNMALSRIFPQERRIELREYTKGNHPQLEIILQVAGGKERSLKLNTGRGLTQIVSFLSILSIIVITKSRKLLVIDEILSGLSARSRRIIADIMWNFTTIGFQFIVNEHGFIPKGAKVYHLVNENDIGAIKNEYIEKNGVFLSTQPLTLETLEDTTMMPLSNEGNNATIFSV